MVWTRATMNQVAVKQAPTILFGHHRHAKHVLLLVLLLLPLASAVEEADAKSIDPMIAEVGHVPAEPQPGTQWEGFIRFEPGHNITAVHYQVCKVGEACFYPPTPASRWDEDTWGFNTTDYGQGDVAWGINEPGNMETQWRVGVQYLVFRDGANESFENAELMPHGFKASSQACKEMGPMACSETHYFAFDMPARPLERESTPGFALWMAVLGLAVLLRRT